MKQIKRFFAIILSLSILVTLLPSIALTANAADFSQALLKINWSHIQTVGHQASGGQACACYSLAYCRTMLDGYVHYYSEYNNGSNQYDAWTSWSTGSYAGYFPSDKGSAYLKIYSELSAGKPVSAKVYGSRSSHHYVTFVGYENVSSTSSLSASNFLIIDPCAPSFAVENFGAVGYDLKYEYGCYQVEYDTTGKTVPFASTTSPVLNIGDDFYAFIISRTAGSWLHLEAAPTDDAKVGNVQIALNGNDSFDSKQIWHFMRQSDGSYKIVNEYNGLCMEGTNWGTEPMTNVCTYSDNGVTCQRWYISGEEGYYTITPQHTSSLVLDVLSGDTAPGTNVELYPPNGSSTQQFDIYNLETDGVSYSSPAKPSASNVTSVLTDSNTTTIAWTVSPEVGKYDRRVYDLRIWKGSEVTDFDNTYASAYHLTGNSYSLHLVDGTYTIMITAKNDNYYERYTFGSYKTVTINSHTHNYTYTVTKSPTSSSTGILSGECPCGAATTVTLPKLNTTDYTYTVTKAATCTATGTGRYTWKTTVYGNFYFDVTIAKAAHTYTATVTAPTCTAQGYTTHTCSACGDSYKDTYANALGHSYTYKVTTTPTTSASGVLTGTCSRCSATTTVTLPKLNTTDYSYSVTKAATCTATGTGRYTWKTTTYGSFYFDVTIAKTAHSYKDTVTAPTCTAQGYTTHTCSSCGDSYKDTYTDALGHNYTYKVTTTPTTSASGVLTGTCSRCSATTTVTLPKLNTTDYSYSVTKAATCTATGTGRYTWKTTTYGSFYFDVTIAKAAHTYTATVTTPTCTEKGYTTHTCTVCGDSYKDTYTDALGHNWDNGVITTQPTEAKEGVKTFTCTRCGETRTESVPVLAHTHSYTAVVTKPTCTEKGYTTYTCPCGDSYVADYVAALGHNWDDGVVTTKPTETSEGVKTFTCSRCGTTKTESVPALDHTHSYTATATPPTCTEKGYTTYTCPCGDSYVADYVDALGHDFADGTCSRCGANDPNYKPIEPDKPCDGGAFCPGKSFTDMPKPNNWAHAGIDFCVENGLFAGTSATTFSPDGNMTRAMLVTVLYRLEGQPAVTASNPFSDVTNGQWFTNAIIWAADKGVVSGVGNGKFNPNGNITREQIATIMYRYAEYKSYDVSATGDLKAFPDETDVSTWAYKALAWANAEGLVSGVGANGTSYLQPLGNATRAQVAAILMRYVKNISKT